ncbi:MAG: translocation/assembly module TamB domain-containing protein [Desulfotignum sp.]|jgi:autotransporter translocation and assembly factor TamB|nr:translocation/assembly module TamB domain-containing protein [Desulfotignum sp.]
MKKKILVTGAVILICLAALVAGLYGYSRTDHAKNLLVDHINTLIPGTLKAERINVLASGSFLRLENLQLQDPQGNICLAFDFLRLDIRLSALFDKVLEIENLHIDRPRLHIAADGSGRINILDALVAGDDTPEDIQTDDQDAAGLPLHVKIRKAGITDGSVVFTDPENTVSAAAVTVEISDADLVQRTAAVFVKISGISLSYPGAAIDIRTFTTAGVLKENDINDIAIDLDSDLGVLTVSGSVEDIFNTRKMHLTLDAAAHLDRVSQISENMPDLGGIVDLSITGTGSLNNPSVQLQINGQNMEMEQTFKKGSLDITMDLAEQVLTIAQGQVNLLDSRMEFSGATDLSSLFPEGFLHPVRDMDRLAYAVSFDQQGGDFARLAPWMPGYSGQFSSHGDIRGKGISMETLTADYKLAVSLTGFKHDQGATDPMDADARLSGKINSLRCTLDNLTVDTKTLQAKASGWYHMGENTLDMDISLAAEDLDAATRAFGLFPVTGKLTAAVHAAGPVSAPDITAALRGRDLGAAGIVLDLVDVEGKLDNTGRAEITRFLVQGQEMKLAASGTARIFDKGFTPKEVIQVSLKTGGQINPGQFLAQADAGIDLQYLDTAIGFDLDTNLDYTVGTTTLDTAGMQHMDIPFQKIGAQIDLGEKTISLSLENMAELAAALDMKKNTYSADLDLRRSDFGPLLSAAGITGIHGGIDGWVRVAGRLPADLPPSVAGHLGAVKGSLTVAADVGGTVDTPVINADMDLNDLAWHLPSPRITVSDLNGRITVSPDHIRIQDIKTRINGGQISLNGDAAFSSSILQTCRLALDAKNLAIPVTAGSKKSDPIQIFDLASDLALDLEPPGLRLEKSGSSSSLFLPVKQITALIDLGKTRLDLQAGTTINLSSVLDPENAHYDLDLTFDNTLVGPFLQTAGFTGTAGTLTGQVTSKGNIAALIPGHVLESAGKAEGTLSVTADIQRNEKKGAGQMDMALILSGKEITLPVSSTPGNTENLFVGMLESALDIHLNYAGAAADFSGSPSAASKDRIPLKNIQAVLNLNRPDKKNTDQKALDLSVTLDHATSLAASFNPDTADFDLDLTFADTRLDRFLETAGVQGIQAVVNGHMLSRGRVNILLPPKITDSLQPASGIVTLAADLDGTFAQPDVNAQLTLADLAYPVPGVNLAISGLTGAVSLSNHHLTIENMGANLGQGSLEMSGDLELENFIPVSGQARLTAKNIALSLEDTAEIAFDTDMTFSGTREKSALTGTILLTKGEYYKDFAFDLAEALESRKMAAAKESKKTDTKNPMMENTTIDIDVDYKDPVVLDNNLAFILVEPDVHISGTLKNPVVTGRARILEGTVVYQKRQFEIETGIIDFVDQFKTDPEITLHAITEIRKWTIHMNISGKTDNLRFRLYSDPAETHEDILSLLVIGKTTKELGQGGGSYTGIFTDKASEMVSQGVESSTPLDEFKLGLDESGDQGANVNVTMGKQLSDRLKIIYSMQTEEQETIHTNAAEYKMLENVLLRAFNDSKGDFGTEVTLKLEFR